MKIKNKSNSASVEYSETDTFLDQIKNVLSLVYELGKIKITGFVALSSAVGYLMFAERFDTGLFVSVFVVLLFAMASAALNHFQERDVDAKMNRTKRRPIPAGRASASTVLYYAVLLTLAGSVAAYIVFGSTTLVLCYLTLFWYNAVYTPMKRKSAMAVVPGALIGALPPIIGWVAAGGVYWDFTILSVAMFLFIWQTPHFWLLLLIFGDDYKNAGLPTLTDTMSGEQLSRLTYSWIGGLVASSLLMFYLNAVNSYFSLAAFALLGIWVLKSSSIILKNIDHEIVKKTFLTINIYVLAAVLVVVLDNLVL